ncbi:hypothetical protein SODALDRAFT_325972 [Sodiomyces alkalinus F11]|uniref:Inositol hexakisphosphate and diphosphoinositol-pentakisphosphate kinase n=1 Tax=Sodiomyces alkalinus (strain CBS 110278 / VKM F-3762 / F11) TaxID=1314773 RepID=A0A3N2Q4U7_SODAK|nr:hypothetical protein SODALDRAFT_325972 [Sodiomyces alkalinus F11]ROT41782.1 hypothetical protein SODALDRAFT_325972 [Sodiomyces alkalinus F11]
MDPPSLENSHSHSLSQSPGLGTAGSTSASSNSASGLDLSSQSGNRLSGSDVQTHHHIPPTSSSASSNGQRTDPSISGVRSDRSHAFMSPSTPPTAVSPGPSISARSSPARSRQGSINSVVPLGEPAVPCETREDGGDGPGTPRLLHSVVADVTSNPTTSTSELDTRQPSLEPTLATRSSFSEADLKRISASSVYSLASARGIVPSSAASITGSETSTAPRSIHSGVVTTGKPTQGTSEPLNATGIPSSGGQQGHQQVSPGGQHLTPRDPNVDAAKRTAGPSRGDQNIRGQPTRSRSRAKRRFSGSTAASSHSPSSERTAHQKEREEAKPAPWGVIGICALDIKARSKPSRNILNRLIANREFDVVVFGDKVILDEDIENWPICDYLISFYSDGFPLDKAIAYAKARKPFCVNDLPMQKILWDRRLCLYILDSIGVPTPKRLEVNRDGGPKVITPDMSRHMKEVSGVNYDAEDPRYTTAPRRVELLDDGDILSVDGALLKKPFVEKPVSGEDHNIIIYFPKSSGGGGRKLFRKIGNKSSEYDPGLNTPRAILEPQSSYIYEKFMRVDNAEDVKAYTVGANYCHAETRKSPVVDGVVRRNTRGKEVRYVTGLNVEEREIASKIALSFGQRVCGFDFLRADGKSYVIDVNGWSFVKDNDDYYDHCANILKELFVKERLRRGGVTSPTSSPSVSDVADPPAARGGKERDQGQMATLPPSVAKSTSSTSAKTGGERGQQESKLDEHRWQLGTLAPRSDSSATSAVQGMTTNPSLPPPPPLRDGGKTSASSTAPSATPSAAASLKGETISEQDNVPAPPLPKHSWKLKGIVSVIRHADRTPKQKYKFTFHTDPFIELLKGHQDEVLLIGEAALASVIQAVDVALVAGIEDPTKLAALRNVLVKKGGWAGTKVQIKPMFRKRKSDEQISAEGTTAQVGDDDIKTGLRGKRADRSLASDDKSRGSHRQDSLSGVTMSRITAVEESLVLDKLQLIVKWGGEPTHSARYQSQELGENMRNDFQLLNRDILDEVHVFSSSERRVSTSAQIWASSFLRQNDLPDDFITIRKDLLDDSNAAKDEMDKVKKKLKGLLRKGNERPPQFAWPDKMPEPSEVQTRVVQLMKFHRRVMQHNYKKLYNGGASSPHNASSLSLDKSQSCEASHSSLSSALSQASGINSIQSRWCCGEDAELFRERWGKLFQEFCDGEKVDPSKISELYDTMKFDALHNRQFLEWVFTPPRHMLEEEYGVREKENKEGNGGSAKEGKDGKPVTKDAEEGKSSQESRDDRREGDRPDRSADANSRGPSSVRRLFRRRSFLNGLRHGSEGAPPEQYFHLYTGNAKTKAKTDARFEPLRELYQLAKVLFDFICPQEYGISDSEKLEIGLLTSLPLLKEIVQNLEEMQASNDAKSFFYFTKESHIYTLLNCIFEGGIETKIKRSTIPELDYLSQICFELYESETKTSAHAAEGEEEPTFAYSIRITISPGCHVFDPLDVQLDSKHCISCAPRRSLTLHADWMEVIRTLRAKFNQVKLPKTFLAINLSDLFSLEDQEKEDTNHGALEIEPQNLAEAPEESSDSATRESFTGEPVGGNVEDVGKEVPAEVLGETEGSPAKTGS